MALLKQLASIIPTLQIRAERLVLEKAQKAKAALEVHTAFIIVNILLNTATLHR
jgi:hypothetical protein